MSCSAGSLRLSLLYREAGIRAKSSALAHNLMLEAVGHETVYFEADEEPTLPVALSFSHVRAPTPMLAPRCLCCRIRAHMLTCL